MREFTSREEAVEFWATATLEEAEAAAAEIIAELDEATDLHRVMAQAPVVARFLP